ncbi:MAG: DUF2892 domain-containing protein [Acidobacteria bacterium]|nr:MAG: DUF2892 domain-containing protein [Acidobacteriota bacterium]
MTFNQGGWDRVIRILAGIALAYAAWLTWPATASVVFVVIGAIVFLTGLVGWCPAYALFGLSTKKRASA